MGIDPVSLAITVALNAAMMAVTASRTIEGPRISDLKATVADYGTPMPYVYGTRRVAAPCFFAENIKEVKKKRKSKGGKYKEYTYFGTWACVIADHEITSIVRIWFDNHLVYGVVDDVESSLFELATGYEFQNHVRFYMGTEDQEPDERMLATIEAAEGVGTCPAYRGVSYIMFEDVPLEKVGNRFPQVSVEINGIGGSGGGSSTRQYPSPYSGGGEIGYEISFYNTVYTGDDIQYSNPSGRFISFDWPNGDDLIHLDYTFETFAASEAGNKYHIWFDVRGNYDFTITSVGTANSVETYCELVAVLDIDDAHLDPSSVYSSFHVDLSDTTQNIQFNTNDYFPDSSYQNYYKIFMITGYLKHPTNQVEVPYDFDFTFVGLPDVQQTVPYSTVPTYDEYPSELYYGEPTIVSQNHKWIMGTEFNSGSYVFDGLLKTEIFTGDLTGLPFVFESLDYEGIKPYAIDDQGAIWGNDANDNGVLTVVYNYAIDPLIEGIDTWTNYGSTVGYRAFRMFAFTMPNGDIQIVIFPERDVNTTNFVVMTYDKFAGTEINVLDISLITGSEWAPFWAFQDEFGNVWVSGSEFTTDPVSTMYLWMIIDGGVSSPMPEFSIITGMPEIDISSGLTNASPFGYYHQGKFICAWTGTELNVSAARWLVIIDMNTGDIEATRDISPSVLYPRYQIDPNSTSFWVTPYGDMGAEPEFNRELIEISATDLSTIRTLNLDLWKPDDPNYYTFFQYFDPVNNAFVVFASKTTYPYDYILAFYYLFDSASDQLILADIVNDVSERVGLDLTEVDTSTLTQPINGYSWSQGTAKQILEPLLTLYDVDARPHGFDIEYVRRGGSPSGLVETEDFVRQQDSRYVLTMSNDTDMPRRMFLTFADISGDQQPNTAVAQRPADAVDSARDISIDMTTLALDPSEARQLTERIMRRTWFQREMAELSLPPSQLALEPADVITLDFDGVELSMRLQKMTIKANGVITTKWLRDNPSIADLSGSVGGAALGRPPSVIASGVDTLGFVLDIPLLADVQEQSVPFLYLAAGPVSDGFWMGADILYSDTGATNDYVSGWDAIGNGDPASHGVVTQALGDAVPDMIDRASVLTVTMAYGELQSITEAAMLASATANLALIGEEIVQFQTATLISTGVYQISNLIRGCRGTEQHMDGHSTLERFLLLDSVVKQHIIGAGEIGDTDYYVPVSQGQDQSQGDVIEVAFTAAANKPYSPAHLTISHDAGSGDFTISWVRRTRIGGSTVNGQNVPLGETSEAYKVEIMGGSSEAVRTIETTSPSTVYSSSMQSSDFGVPQSFISVRVAQVSPSLSLDGFFASASG